MPGDKVEVFDSSLFVDDVKTPLSITYKPATIVCRYGQKSKAINQDGFWYYPDLVDVVFDHRPELVSHGHFTNGIDVISTITGREL